MIVPPQYVSLKPTRKVRSPRRDTGGGVRSDAPQAGANLRAAREHLGWALPDVAAMLRIRAVYLEALEAGRLRQLPGKVYARGFLRSYAAALGLDAEQVAERYWAEAGDVAKRGDPLFFNPVLQHRVSTTVALVICVVVLGTGWFIWSGWNDSDSDTMEPVPPPQASLVDRPPPGRDTGRDRAQPLTEAPAPRSRTDDRRLGSGKPAPGTNMAQTRPAKPGASGQAGVGETENLLLEPDGAAQPPQASNTGARTPGGTSTPAIAPSLWQSPGPTASPGQVPSGQVPSGQVPSGQAPSGQASSGQASSGQAPSGQAPSGQAPSGATAGGSAAPNGLASGSNHPEAATASAPGSTPVDGQRIVLHFTADSWVQIKEPGGRVLLMKIMKAGQTYAVPDRPDLIMTTGNAGGIEIAVDGTTLPPLGTTGTIRKDVSLDPERLKNAPSLTRR